MRTIRVAMLVKGEHDIFARGVRACLRDDPRITLVEAHDDAADVAVGYADGAARRAGAPCPLVVCVADEEQARAARAIPNVAAVLPVVSVTSEQLTSAVHAAAAGLRFDMTEPDADLDERSVRVLQLLSDGAATAEIASELGYSERTIKSVIYAVERELGAKNRTHAVATAVRRQLI